MNNIDVATIKDVGEEREVVFLGKTYDKALVGLKARFGEEHEACYDIKKIAQIKGKKLNVKNYLSVKKYVNQLIKQKKIRNIDKVSLILTKSFEELADEFPETLKPDGHEKTCMGVLVRETPISCFSRDKILDELYEDFTESDRLSPDEEEEDDRYFQAIEYFDYNIIGAWVGEGTPAFVETSF